MSNFKPLEFGGRDSETQLQVDENLNKIRIRVKNQLIFLKTFELFNILIYLY